MDGGSADHAGAVICRPAGDRRIALTPVARRAGSYSLLKKAPR
jgi:hypothetical protein